MTEPLSRLIPLLEKDVVATLGEEYRHVVRGAVEYLEYDGAGYDEKVVENVQQFHDTFVYTTWPVCPRHGWPIFRTAE